ncbi:hypothetical protein [Paenibacillus harenae]|uniref:hypothetical protein n=1 Tax=Paenibacillus harenae TaxID=306543 RepID=UPI00278FEA94|nr:hypothetical protein [Paenibacillus harenae]MDQ0062371.1 hypothetical protein [Paenibacillus harenae]
MEKRITITMNQIDGSIEYEHDGKPTYAEALGMLEYTKMIVTKEWMEEIGDV